MTVKNVPWFWSNLAIAYLVRALFVGTTIWIIILCVERQYSLLTMHIAFSTIGCGLLMIEATLVVSGDPYLSTKIARKNRITIHWILHIGGLISLAIGFGHVIVMKVRSGAAHFVTDHAIIGLVGYLLPFVIAILAIPTVCTSLLPRCFSLVNCKNIHIFLGVAAYIMLWAGQFTGFSKGSWRGSAAGTDATKLAYVVGGCFLLAKPLYTTLLRQCGRST